MILENQVGIYCIRNKLNDKRYIGQSVRLSQRLNYHLNIAPWNPKSCEYDTPIHKAIRKYGIDSFEVNVVEYCDCALLDEREIYWIDYYQTFPVSTNKGYNQTPGGNNYLTKLDFLYPKLDEITALLMYSNYTQAEIAQMMGSSPGMIQQINTGKCWYRDNISYPIRKFHLHKVSNSGSSYKKYPIRINYCNNCGCEIDNSHKFCVECYSEWKKRSKRPCPDDFIDKAKILKTKTALCEYYHTGNILINKWLKELDINLSRLHQKKSKKLKKPYAKKVAKYLSLDALEPVFIYNSIYAASRSTGSRAPSMITKACLNKTSYKGYYWRYIE